TRTTAGAGNYVAVMSATAGAHLFTSATNYNFDATVRPVYVSAIWTPNPTTSPATTAASFTGMSIATRATLADLPSTGTDDFTTSPRYGVTFRFFCGTTDNITNGGPCADATSSTTTPAGANI